MVKSIEFSPATGEDAGKIFVITRMSAFQADKWARRIVKALIQAGARLPESTMDEGLLGLSGMAVNLFGQLDNAACDEAFDALLACCAIKRGPNTAPSAILEYDITDAETLPALRTEAFRLHVDFFKAAASQISPLAAVLMPGAERQDSAPAA